MKNFREMTVGEIVSQNIEYAKVFQKHKVDFCCGGDVALSKAVESAGAALKEVVEELQAVPQSSLPAAFDFNNWSLDLLIDYIVKFHHNRIRTEGPKLLELIKKVVNAHGSSDPRLGEVEAHFRASLVDLYSHLDKEEQILFPLVHKLLEAEQSGCAVEEFHCGSVENPIRVMMMEHDNEGERFRVISKLTDGYSAPEFACGSYRLMLSQLREFEENLHIHIHVENNILFVKAMEIEERL